MAGLIHVGANDGHEYLGSDRRMVLIEPQRAAFQRLHQNFGASPNVSLVNLAVGSETGRVEMRVASPDHSSSLLEPRKHLELMPHITFDGTELVWVDTLDNIMRTVTGDFDELVVDVQGFELEVLKGATVTLGKVRRVKCEVNTEEVFAGCPMIEDIDRALPGFERVETDLYGGCWGDAVYVR